MEIKRPYGEENYEVYITCSKRILGGIFVAFGLILNNIFIDEGVFRNMGEL